MALVHGGYYVCVCAWWYMEGTMYVCVHGGTWRVLCMCTVSIEGAGKLRV